MKLTISELRKVTPDPDRDLVLFDDELRGFGLRMKPSRRTSYFVQYRNRYGRSRRHTFAKGEEMPPEKARERAKALLGGVAAGQDPAEEKKGAARHGHLPRARQGVPREAPQAAAQAEHHPRIHPRARANHPPPHLQPQGDRELSDYIKDRLHSSLGYWNPADERVAGGAPRLIELASSWVLAAPGATATAAKRAQAGEDGRTAFRFSSAGESLRQSRATARAILRRSRACGGERRETGKSSLRRIGWRSYLQQLP